MRYSRSRAPVQNSHPKRLILCHSGVQRHVWGYPIPIPLLSSLPEADSDLPALNDAVIHEGKVISYLTKKKVGLSSTDTCLPYLAMGSFPIHTDINAWLHQNDGSPFLLPYLLQSRQTWRIRFHCENLHDYNGFVDDYHDLYECPAVRERYFSNMVNRPRIVYDEMHLCLPI